MGNRVSQIQHPLHGGCGAVGERRAVRYFGARGSDLKDIEFSPSESYLAAYSIDRQLHLPPRGVEHLGHVVEKDCRLICNSLVKAGVIPGANIERHVSSKEPKKCSAHGMRDGICDQARKVGPEGIFIVYFSGHGVETHKGWSLAPFDFDSRNSGSHITGDMLSVGFHEVGCKAKAIVILLDCCNAEGLANSLTDDQPDCDIPETFVFAACRAFHVALAIPCTLKHSVFSYFLAKTLERKIPHQIQTLTAKLPIAAIVDECSTCCDALSSLSLGFDESSQSIIPELMQPQFRHHLPQSQIVADEDEEEFLLQYYRTDFEDRPKLAEECTIWLQIQTSSSKGPLKNLIERGILKGEVLSTVICCTMRSLAAVELQCDRENSNNPDVFLCAFSEAATFIGNCHSAILRESIEFTHDHLKESLGFYIDVIENTEKSVRTLKQLHKRMRSYSPIIEHEV